MQTQLPLSFGSTAPTRLHVESLPPQYIKYMGSKAKIIEFVVKGINEVYSGGGVCDLFAGSSFVGGAIRHQAQVFSNDIQAYSAVLASAYLKAWIEPGCSSGQQLVQEAERLVEEHARNLPIDVKYKVGIDLKAFNAVEERTGMISQDELRALAEETLGSSYQLASLNADHRHMIMGRRNDRHRNVEESLLLARRRKRHTVHAAQHEVDAPGTRRDS